MITGPAHLKIVLIPSSTRRPSLPNSGPRWSMTGISIARRMRSGTGVGPGICRKWRPALREEFCDMRNPVSSFKSAWEDIRNRDVANDYAISGAMTKLLEQAMGKIREMPQADQDRAADFLFAHAARHSGPKKRDEETPAAIREGV